MPRLSRSSARRVTENSSVPPLYRRTWSPTSALSGSGMRSAGVRSAVIRSPVVTPWGSITRGVSLLLSSSTVPGRSLADALMTTSSGLDTLPIGMPVLALKA